MNWFKNKYIKLFFLIWLCILIFNTFMDHFNIGFDNTDDNVNHVRSNLVIYTDYGTGCQYLQGGMFGDNIVPRTDDTGKQVCIKIKDN